MTTTETLTHQGWRITLHQDPVTHLWHAAWQPEDVETDDWSPCAPQPTRDLALIETGSSIRAFLDWAAEQVRTTKVLAMLGLPPDASPRDALAAMVQHQEAHQTPTSAPQAADTYRPGTYL
jgi:hypothetical protein